MTNRFNTGFDHCIKCTVCDIYCPVARATRFYLGPKRSGPDMERFRVKNPDIREPSILYCNNCKRCDIACPSGVQLSDMITRAKLNYAYKKFRPRDYLISHTDIVGKIATRFSSLVNFINRRLIVKWLLKVFLKIDSQSLPEYAKGTFDNRRKKQPVNQKKRSKTLCIFQDAMSTTTIMTWEKR